ncbi:MAG: putative addiction module antidote protein [Bacteriovoracales bacterium]|nr:putative addiction module antidote protein [Bacteriovoracales bacterium]
MGKGTSFNDYLITRLQDPEIACHFISQAIEENDSDYLKIALGDIIKAHKVSYISEKTGIGRQTIYKMFSKNGNPTHKNLVAILDVLGLELTVKPKMVKA